MSDQICNNCKADKYAEFYKKSKRDIELFEKVKELHEYCEKNNLGCQTTFVLPDEDKPYTMFVYGDCSQGRDEDFDKRGRNEGQITNNILHWMAEQVRMNLGWATLGLKCAKEIDRQREAAAQQKETP